MVKGVDVAGRVVLDGGGDDFPRGMGSGLMAIASRDIDDAFDVTGAMDIVITDDHTFSFKGLTGRRRFDIVNLPQDWYVKSVRYNGEDITEDAAELKSEKNATLEVAISTRGATISGHAFGDDGQAVKRGVAVIFPVNQTQWKGNQPWTARITETGAFKLGPRRPGDYFVAALEYIEVPDGDPRPLFARLAEVAERVTLTENEQQTIDLRIVHLK